MAGEQVKTISAEQKSRGGKKRVVINYSAFMEVKRRAGKSQSSSLISRRAGHFCRCIYEIHDGWMCGGKMKREKKA